MNITAQELKGYIAGFRKICNLCHQEPLNFQTLWIWKNFIEMGFIMNDFGKGVVTRFQKIVLYFKFPFTKELKYYVF